MTDWTKVVTQPLGLVGFALFLVFGYLARVKSRDERRWLSPATIALAVIALLGGLFLSYQQIPKPQSQPVQAMQMQSPASQQTNSDVQQASTGEGSPNVQGVQGDVTITIDQSNGKTESRNPSSKKPKPDRENK